MSNNFVYSICEDKNGNIWVGTKNGLNFLDYTSNQFTNFFHDPNKINSIASNRINVVYCDHSGIIWVGTDKGLDRIELNKNDNTNLQITHFKNIPNCKHPLLYIPLLYIRYQCRERTRTGVG